MPAQEPIKVSPALLRWIHRTPSNKVAVHRERWNAVPVEENEEENATDL